MKTKTASDRVREFARLEYIEPAKRSHESTVRIVAGEVHKAVNLSNRVPLVCQALKSHKFLDENHLVLEKCEGPPSGMGTTVTLTYRVINDDGTAFSSSPEWPFLSCGELRKRYFATSVVEKRSFGRSENGFTHRRISPGEDQ